MRNVALSISIMGIVFLISCGKKSPTEATLIDQTQHIEEGYYWYGQLSFKGYSTIEVSVEVTQGDAIDVFLIDESNFTKFKNNESFMYYTAGSALNIKSKTYSFTPPGEGTYYIIVDNAWHLFENEAIPTGPVDVHIKIVAK